MHLQPQHSRITQDFFKILETEAAKADALYILGDLFEVWLGDDDSSEFNHSIIQALANASAKGLPIYLLRGNRDFLLGRHFAQACGAKLLCDPSLIDLYGEKTLLMHGDNLCTFDRLHQLWFKVSRHPYNETIAQLIPLSLRRSLSKWMRNRSQKHQNKVESYKLDVKQETVEKAMQHHQAQLLIHGHTHQPGIHTFSHQNKTFVRIVLGSWHEKMSILKYESTGNYYLL